MTFSFTRLNASCVSWFSRVNSEISPLIQVAEAVAVRVLRQNIRIGDRQVELFQPVVRHGRVDFGRLQRRGLTVRANEMFFRNEDSGAAAECPERRLTKAFGRLIHLD